MYVRESVEVEAADSQFSTAEVYVKAKPSQELLSLPCVAEYSLENHTRDYVPGPKRPAEWLHKVSTTRAD